MNPEMGKAKKVRRVYLAREKAEAILSMWAKRRSPHRIYKELKISWTVLNGWEKRAIQGMLQGLGGEVLETPKGILGPRLEKLMTELTVITEIKTMPPETAK